MKPHSPIPIPDDGPARTRVHQLIALAQRRSDRVIALLCAGVVLVGLLYSVRLGSDLAFADERDYLSIADNLVEKGMFSADGQRPTADRPPAWPFFLAGLRFIGLPIVLLRVVNVALFASCLYLLYLLLRTAWSPLVGLAGAMLALGYGLFFFTAETLYPQMFEAALLLLLLYLLFGPVPREPTGRILAGTTAGFLMLTSPRWILLLPVVLLLLPGPRRARAMTGLVVVLVALVILGGWTVRNLIVFDRVILVSSNIGGNLLVGNSPDFGEQVREAEDLDEVESDRYLASRAIQWALENKRLAGTLYLERFLDYFAFRNQLATKSQSSLLKEVVLAVSYGFLILLALGRILLRKQIGRVQIDHALLVLYLASALVAALAAPRIRYRVPFDFLLVGLGAPVIAKLLAPAGEVSPAGTGGVPDGLRTEA